MASINVKVVFPKSSPVASKTFTFESNVTIKQAIEKIRAQVVVPGLKEPALWVEPNGFYLQDGFVVSDYASLFGRIDHVELRDRSGVPPALLAAGAAALAAIVAGAVYYYKFRK